MGPVDKRRRLRKSRIRTTRNFESVVEESGVSFINHTIYVGQFGTTTNDLCLLKTEHSLSGSLGVEIGPTIGTPC